MASLHIMGKNMFPSETMRMSVSVSVFMTLLQCCGATRRRAAFSLADIQYSLAARMCISEGSWGFDYLNYLLNCGERVQIELLSGRFVLCTSMIIFTRQYLDLAAFDGTFHIKSIKQRSVLLCSYKYSI